MGCGSPMVRRTSVLEPPSTSWEASAPSDALDLLASLERKCPLRAATHSTMRSTLFSDTNWLRPKPNARGKLGRSTFVRYTELALCFLFLFPVSFSAAHLVNPFFNDVVRLAVVLVWHRWPNVLGMLSVTLRTLSWGEGAFWECVCERNSPLRAGWHIARQRVRPRA